MPRGWRNMYAEFTTITRHVLQVSSTGEKKLLQQVQDFADGHHPEGFQISDSSQPLIIHKPFGSDEFGPQPDGEGPFMFAGNVFDSDPNWLRKLAGDLLDEADKLEADLPTVRLFKKGVINKHRCLRCRQLGTVEYTLTSTKPREQLLYLRCTDCGWRQNLGWYGDQLTGLYNEIRELNGRKAEA